MRISCLCGHFESCPSCDPYWDKSPIGVLTAERDALKAENERMRVLWTPDLDQRWQALVRDWELERRKRQELEAELAELRQSDAANGAMRRVRSAEVEQLESQLTELIKAAEVYKTIADTLRDADELQFVGPALEAALKSVMRDGAGAVGSGPPIAQGHAWVNGSLQRVDPSDPRLPFDPTAENEAGYRERVGAKVKPP